MRHVLIYGPPAAGKLTVARPLAERYGMILLDNHLTFDVALCVFDFGTPEFNRLVERLRVVLLEETAAAGRDSVSTFVFSHPGDLPYIDRFHALADRLGLTVDRVQLCPPPDVLAERVVAPSRAATQKVRDRDTLRGLLDGNDLYTPIDDGDLRIDNSATSPDEVLAEIATRFSL